MDFSQQPPSTNPGLAVGPAEPAPGLDSADDMTDVTFVVDGGKKLYMNKTVLSIASPVFKAMFTADFKEKSTSQPIPLPGKKYSDMLVFFKLMHPVYSAAEPITDEILKQVLQLADEYQVQSPRKKCEQYIDHRIDIMRTSTQIRIPVMPLSFVQPGSSMSDDLLLWYLWVCDAHKLADQRERLMKIGIRKYLTKLQESCYFSLIPETTVRELMERRLLGSEKQGSLLS